MSFLRRVIMVQVASCFSKVKCMCIKDDYRVRPGGERGKVSLLRV